MSVHTVSIYLIDRAYGGPEEGGWWFTYGEPQVTEHLRAFSDKEEAEAYRESLQPILQEMNEGRPNINSVLSEGLYVAIIDEDEFPAPFPKERPQYE